MRLIDCCKTSTKDEDSFVGIKYNEKGPQVTFPKGYRLSNDEKELRRDVLRLLSTIQRMSEKREGENRNIKEEGFEVDFPFFSYQYVIKDFLKNGYYVEKEIEYVERDRGKISWKRTIQRVSPQVNEGNFFYLDFIVGKNETNENNLITLIHKYCVGVCFAKIGWLYFPKDFIPETNIKPNRKLFVKALKKKANSTFNQDKKILFNCMIDILYDTSEEIDEKKSVSFGVNRFEYVWESLVDYIFGEDDKEKYFPHAEWHILENEDHFESSALRPDTIMLLDKKVYILDAKYYRSGITGRADHLPATDSIQKQITYGNYMYNSGFAGKNNIYSAFIMPFSASDECVYKIVGIGKGKWEPYNMGTENYKYVVGIFVDTKYLITTYVKHNMKEIEMMSDLIEGIIEKYKKKQYSNDG